ncbi:MAG TPA: signal recognition particle-docking protein FtsY [Firmicutes bacterium]|jgi:fused signal recognition particle receptor|nr:signal recognition particle-docking protein FtsY [Bacillota bacterium]
MTDGFVSRLKASLTKTRQRFLAPLEEAMLFHKKISPEFYEELEEILIASDVGYKTTSLLLDKLKEKVKTEKTDQINEIKGYLREIMTALLSVLSPPDLDTDLPLALLVVGVNGVGKTTSIAKLAEYYKGKDKSCLLVAGDTFRAAAIDQLRVWGQRLGIDLIHHQEGADPGAVAFDGISAANARKVDVAIFDTAGRLHTKVNLMTELEKVHRVVSQNLGERRLLNLLVLDATTGQNALSQARAFHEAVGIDGIILTKLDGTAKGGIVLAIAAELGLPIVWLGIGEQSEDLRRFDPDEFVKALFA